MSWFRRFDRPVNRRLREVKKELRDLESEMRRLQTSPPPEISDSKRGLEIHNPQSKTLLPTGNLPTRSLSSREMDFFAPTEKEFIRVQPETPPSESNVPPPAPTPASRITARIAPNQTKARLAFYLRTGTVQTLKPLRYERRVARNRTIVWVLGAAGFIFLAVNLVYKFFHH